MTPPSEPPPAGGPQNPSQHAFNDSDAQQTPWSDRDIFDDVPEDGARAGTHRALDAPAPRATKEILGLLIAGALALAVGAVAYVVGVDPDARVANAGTTASPTATQETTPSTDGAALEPDPTVQVGVYNAASVDGAAGTAAQQLSGAGWNVASIENWGVAVNQSVVYYADEQEQARAIADELGIEEIIEDDAVSYPVVVVIGTDIAGGPTAEPVQEVPQEQAPVQEAPVEQAPVEPAPVEQAPVEQVPVDPAPVAPAPVPEVPAPEYVDPNTGVYP